MKRTLVGALLLTLATTTSAQDRINEDQSIRARSILPPGQGSHPNLVETAEWFGQGTRPPHNDDQYDMYDGLIEAEPSLTDDDLHLWFKDHTFHNHLGPNGTGSIAKPNDGSVVIRDARFGVPHVYGQTRADTAFAAGWATARDRLFVMDVVRHLARGRLSELLGASESNLAFDRGQQAVMDYSEEEIAGLGDYLLELDPELGATVLADLRAYADGVNKWIVEALTDPLKLPAIYPALQIVPEPWTVNDCLAITSLVGGLFSPGGAGQLENEVLLSKLEDHFGDPAVAREVFDDFRRALDPEAPTTVEGSFPFNDSLPPPDPAAVARPDDPEAVLAEFRSFGSPETIDTPLGPFPFEAGSLASNALLVAPGESDTGGAFAVMGPQIGYWTPEVVYEMEMHGPGIAARGITVPGMGPAVIIGRGPNWAWSLTTAVADHQDIRAVRLCEPDGSEPSTDSGHYRNEGSCDPMFERLDVWLAKPSAAGIPEPSPNRIVLHRKVERTRHGMVVARGTVDGEPAAFVRQRSSYRKDSGVLLGWTAAMDPSRNPTIEALRDNFEPYSLAFNIFLIHGSDIGYVLGGIYPKLPAGVDPDLVFWGDQEWDWAGFLDFSTEHPQVVRPAKDFIVNWNNSQAPDFRAADSNYSYGSVHRSELLERGLAEGRAPESVAGESITLAEVVRAMERGATQDLRAVRTYPFLREVIGTPPSELADTLSMLDAWADDGGHRRDVDADGLYEHREAILLMDEWWPRAIRQIFEPVIGTEAFEALPFALDDTHAGGGSFSSAWHGIFEKDLRSVLAHPVEGPLSRIYCGGGVLADCRETLLRTLEEAVAAPKPQEPIENRDVNEFTSVGLIGQPPMHWQNRPTYQQVLEFR